MKDLKEKVLSLIFPPRCAVCGEVLTLEEQEGFLCKNCVEDIPYIAEGECPHCGGSTETAGFCEDCVKHFAFDSACAAFPYEAVRTAIHLFKYDGGKEIGRGLGQLMAEYLKQYHEELLVKTDVITAVPLYPKKEKNRGFNQANILSEAISQKTGLIFEKNGLTRKRDTAAQSLLNPDERKENLKDAFGAAGDFAGKRVLLVDDIFTTGSTCQECARTLYRAGAKEVMVFSLSKAGVHKGADGDFVCQDCEK